jgi:hypothetical protein
MKTYDYIVIGSGPIAIIESSILDAKKKTVLIVDDKKQLGGAWVTTDLGLYGRLELGCHIWSYNKRVYEFLNFHLDLQLIKLTPQPFFLKNNTKISYDYKNAFLTLRGLFKVLRKLNYKLFKDFVKLPSSRVPILPKSYLYPKGGAREFQDSLIKIVKDSEIDIKLESRIQSLEKKAGNWTINMQDGELLSSKNIIMTSTSSIEKITTKQRELSITPSQVNYTHYHLVIKGNIDKSFSYIRVLDHDFIHRISDITYQLETNFDKDIFVLLVGVIDNKLDDIKGSILLGIIEYLKKAMLVTPESEVVYSKKNTFITSYINDDQKSIINNLDDSLELLHTTDLIYGMYNRLPKWK